jgi:hypothetical protein
MLFNWISKNPARADEAAMGAIHRPLHCHPERSEGSVAMGSEMLRCAQHDRAVTQTNVWINVFMCIIGPYGWPNDFIQCHYCAAQINVRVNPGKKCTHEPV